MRDEFARLNPREYLEAPPTDQADAKLVRWVHGQTHRLGTRSGLCLSGGGIRSASFSLGVLQGLARHGLLTSFDYLSTVSGGGYIGSWLAAWASRQGFAKVAEDLAGPEPETVRHLRQYSNYLSPRTGLLSLDTWVLIGIYLRNLLLNWTVLVPVLLALPLVVILVEAVAGGMAEADLTASWAWLWAVQTLSGAFAVWFIVASRPGRGSAGVTRSRADVLFLCLVPLGTAAASFVLTLRPSSVWPLDDAGRWASSSPAFCFGLLACVFLWGGSVHRFNETFSVLVGSATTAGLLFWIAPALVRVSTTAEIVTLWPPAFLVCFLLGATV